MSKTLDDARAAAGRLAGNKAEYATRAEAVISKARNAQRLALELAADAGVVEAIARLIITANTSQNAERINAAFEAQLVAVEVAGLLLKLSERLERAVNTTRAEADAAALSNTAKQRQAIEAYRATLIKGAEALDAGGAQGATRLD